MKTLFAFVKKDFLQQIRSPKLYILLGVFVLLGIMNPAITKLTPLMMELLSESLEASGMTVSDIPVDAMTSWTQFFKNIPIGLLVFIILQSNILTRECEKGTLIAPLTKGLERYKVILSKTVVLTSLWSLYYWLSFGITYLANQYYWQNADVNNILISSFAWWLAGLWTTLLIVLFSTLARVNILVLLYVGGTYLASYLLTLLPKAAEFSPAYLMSAAPLLYGMADPDTYIKAIITTVVLIIAAVIAAIPIFNKKQL